MTVPSSSAARARLPAYLLARRLAAGRRVLDLGSASTEGPLLVAAAGALRVVAWGPKEKAPSLEILDGDALPAVELLPSGEFDLVVCVDLLDRLAVPECARCLDLTRRLLAPTGCALIGLAGSGAAFDYWGFAGALRDRFPEVTLLAQSPMTGAYLAVVEPISEATELWLCDELAPEPAPAARYLALVAKQALPELERYQLIALPAAPGGEEIEPLRAEVALLAQRLREREAELLGVAGKTARVARLEQELAAARAGAGALPSLRSELAQLAADATRQREEAAGLRRELDDTRRACDDLARRTSQAEHAATELALERDRVSARHASLIEGQRELAAEFERLRIRSLEEQAELEARARLRESAQGEVERARVANTLLEQEARALRAELAQLLPERDRLREALLALEERDEQLEVERRGLLVARGELEARLAELGAETEERVALERAAAIAEQEALLAREREARARVEGGLGEARAAGESARGLLEAAELRLAELREVRDELAARVAQRERELDQLRLSREGVARELEAAEGRACSLAAELASGRHRAAEVEAELRRSLAEAQSQRAGEGERARIASELESALRERELRLEERVREVAGLEQRVAALVGALEASRDELAGVRSRLATAQAEVTAACQGLVAAGERQASLERERGELAEQLALAEAARGELTERLATAESVRAELEARLRARARTIVELEASASSAQQARAAAEREVGELTARLAALERDLDVARRRPAQAPLAALEAGVTDPAGGEWREEPTSTALARTPAAPLGERDPRERKRDDHDEVTQVARDGNPVFPQRPPGRGDRNSRVPTAAEDAELAAAERIVAALVDDDDTSGK